MKEKSPKPKLSYAEQVDLHIQKLEPGLAEIVQALREIILSTDAEIAEQIKWNNPAFYYSGEMQAFDPKEYKRDIIVFNLFKGRIMLVFPSGAKIRGADALLEGKYADGRKVAVFKDLAEVQARKDLLQAALRDWLSQVEK